jgi:hypothetical protein
MTVKLGSFTLLSGKVMVTDPCYDRSIWCQGELEKVAPGTWEAYSERVVDGSWGMRVSELVCFLAGRQSEDVAWERASFTVGVDSGQAGVFEDAHYQDDTVLGPDTPKADYISDSPWYAACCAANSLNGGAGGVIPYGAVASSGYGDGSYQCFFRRADDGLIDAIKIVFIGEDDPDEYDEDHADDELLERRAA